MERHLWWNTTTTLNILRFNVGGRRLRGFCVINRILTLSPYSARLMWHHVFKGIVKEERNADISSPPPLTWTCNWPGRVESKRWRSDVRAPGLRMKHLDLQSYLNLLETLMVWQSYFANWRDETLHTIYPGRLWLAISRWRTCTCKSTRLVLKLLEVVNDPGLVSPI